METVRSKLFGEGYYPYPNELFLDPDLQGWASTSETFKEVLEFTKPRLVIEVGTWKGCSAIHMANLLTEIHGDRNFEIVCIDTFLGSVEHWNRTSYVHKINYGRPIIYETFINNVIYTKNTDVITPFPVDSRNGWQTLESFGVLADLVYIDAGHDYDAVSSDIIGFSKILKPGGILLGDDIHHEPIRKACNDLLNNWVQSRDKFIWTK